MACKWMDGGELWGNSTSSNRAYLSRAGISYPATPRIAPGVRSIQGSTAHMTTPSLGVQNTWIIGFGLNVPDSSTWQWKFLNGASEQLRLELVDSGSTFELRLVRGSTTIATTSSTFAYDVWHYFELKVTLTDTGTYELRHNEQSVLSDAGPVDLQELGSPGADGHSWFHSGGTQIDMDDIYICDDTGGVNDDFLGDSVIFLEQPNSDGATNNWTQIPSSPTTNFDKVADDPTAVDDNTYVETNTNMDKDLYAFTDLPAAGIGTIFAVKLAFEARMASMGTATVTPKFRAGGGSEANGDDFVVDGTSYAGFNTIFDQDPVAAATWTKTEFDNGQFGMERKS